ncbi:MAG: glutamyl-tRNA amidotransferase [Erysipelotrichaceae bacterium]
MNELKWNKKVKTGFIVFALGVLYFCFGTTPVFAAGDPLTAVNNFSTFVFALIRAIGIILLGFGVVQVGLSLKSHDPSQRANGFLTLAGGIVITFAKEILDLIIA